MFRNISRPNASLNPWKGKRMRTEVLMIVFVVCGLIITLSVLFLRNRQQQLLHMERMAALEKGASLPPAEERPWSPRVYLLRGLIWSFSGAALFLCLISLAGASRQPASAEQMAYDAKRLSDYAGISFEEAKQTVAKDAALHARGLPDSVACLGFLPISVGLAYLVFYFTGESRKRAGGHEAADTGQRMA